MRLYTQVMQGNLEQNYLHVSLEVMACGEGVHNLELLQLGAVIGVNGQRFFYPASPHQVRPKDYMYLQQMDRPSSRNLCPSLSCVSSSVADPDPGSGIRCFLTPGSGIRNRFFPDPGSRISEPGSRIPRPYF